MKESQFDPIKNYEESRAKIAYVPRKEATQEDYNRIGFKSGLEVHQQLLTEKKLFCNCKAGIFHKNDQYDAEVIRHMRPTLSELGEYDGTALMEFRTKKEITYRINNENACTYEVDDTPPFLINREALDKALQITMLSKFNVVGEVHITRKQYLDGSIPTGFQRTAILGVEGEIKLKNKKVRLIQLSIEEDSCREISDIGHKRIYKTDRLGMPLIETVTYPDMVNPDEVKEACDYIRFLNRSSQNVRTGIGASRQDVNVSCTGGTRVEIKGVAHTKWIPELTHNECFRQWALLSIREELKKRFNITKDYQNEKQVDFWKINHIELNFDDFKITTEAIKQAKENNYKLIAVNLQNFKGILSYFTQPGKCFADEISDRLKVIACIEKPNMIHSELPHQPITNIDMEIIKLIIDTDEEKDSLIIFWAAEEDVKTALETIEERCKMAFCGVPNETRKSFEDGTTIFERVLPGADRMYPDTDSTPIPLDETHLEKLRKNLPEEDICDRMAILKSWNFTDDSLQFILSKNLFPIIKNIINAGFESKLVATIFGKNIRNLSGKYNNKIDYNRILEMLQFIKSNNLENEIVYKILPELFKTPESKFETILSDLNFKKYSKEEIILKIESLNKEFEKVARNNNKQNKVSWIMEELRNIAFGNIRFSELYKIVSEKV